jgi:hypothetical protein
LWEIGSGADRLAYEAAISDCIEVLRSERRLDILGHRRS